MARVSSNNPFSNKPSVRKGAGPVYNTIKNQPNVRKNSKKAREVKEPCFGPYDNLVKYVFEVDTETGNRLAYVDCDYVD